jgi:hypothetical protein
LPLRASGDDSASHALVAASAFPTPRDQSLARPRAAAKPLLLELAAKLKEAGAVSDEVTNILWPVLGQVGTKFPHPWPDLKSSTSNDRLGRWLRDLEQFDFREGEAA